MTLLACFRSFSPERACRWLESLAKRIGIRLSDRLRQVLQAEVREREPRRVHQLCGVGQADCRRRMC